MHTFTALYDRQADAEAVQAELERLGIIDLDHGLHGGETAAYEDDATGPWAGGRGVAPPEADRHIYKEATKHGGFLLTVNVDDAEADRVHQFLENSNAVDIEERERAMKASGFAPPVPAAPPARMAGDDQPIHVVEERLNIGKRQVDRGGVRVRTYVAETPVSETVSLREEHVDIERRPINERVADAEALLQERDIELDETAEEVVVGKEARVVGEVGLRKDVEQRTETVRDTVRHTEVEVERIEPGVTPSVRR